jgi:hypothetical protein
MTKVQYVRDTPLAELPEAVTVLRELLESTQRPVLLDGALTAAAASLADRLPAVQAPTIGDERAQRFFLERAEIPSWALSGIGPGEGLGALAGLASLRLALLAAG